MVGVIDDIKTEIASSDTKMIVRVKALGCIKAVSEAAEAVRIAKARPKLKLLESGCSCEACGRTAFFEVMQMEASDRLTEIAADGESANIAAFDTLEGFEEV